MGEGGNFLRQETKIQGYGKGVKYELSQLENRSPRNLCLVIEKGVLIYA
jgi:hypothetical protein